MMFTLPYENLGYASSWSSPTCATISPITPDIQPLTALPLLVRLPQMMTPNRLSRKNSQLPNCRDTLVRSGVRVRTQITLISVPMQEAVVARKIARPPLPLLASGNPSSAVAALAGVPGIFNSTAAWQPPEMAPTYTPIREMMALVDESL